MSATLSELPSPNARDQEAPRPASAATDRLRRSAAVVTGLVLFDLAVWCNGYLPARVLVLAVLLLVPGSAIVALLPFLGRDVVLAWAYRLGLSVGMALIVGGCTNLLSMVGVARPLDRLAVTLGYNVLLALLALPWLATADRVWPFADVGLRWSPRRLLALLPLVAAAGAERLDGQHGNAVAVLSAVACLLLLVFTACAGRRWHTATLAAVLFSVALALQWAYSLRSGSVVGWDVQQEFRVFAHTQDLGRWNPGAAGSYLDGDAYNSLLSITVLPTLLSNLTGMSGALVFKMLFPLLYATVPVVAFCFAARYAARIAAFLAAALIIVQGSFFQQMPAVTRQQVALLFFALLVVTAFDPALPRRQGRLLVFAFATALVVCHYSTAYFAVLTFAPVALAMAGLQVLRRRPPQHRALTLPLLGYLVLAAFLWNGVLTHSASNIAEFRTNLGSHGLHILPNAGGGPIDRYLAGNAPARLSLPEYSGDVGAHYRALPWLSPYPASEVARYPLTSATATTGRGPLSALHPVVVVAAVVASQSLILLALVGITTVTVLALRHRRRTELELGLVGASVLALLSVIRLSGSTAGAYNQERALQQALLVLVVPLSVVVGRGLRRAGRVRQCVLAGGAGLLAALLVTTGGLAAMATGGDAALMLNNGGEDYERFLVHPPEMAAANWLAQARVGATPIFTDRYGQLRLWVVTDLRNGVLPDLAPNGFSSDAWVYATTSNVVANRARGAVDQRFVSFAFPAAFLAAHKDLVYATATTRIYK